jgi:hypothetical protein
MKKLILPLILSLVTVSFHACKDDKDPTPKDENHDDHDDDHHHENEVITTLSIHLMDTLSNPIDTFYWRDTDGPGGNTPMIDEIILDPNMKYMVSLMFWDESDPNDIENMTTEIKNEDDEHLVCYTPNSLNGLMIDYNDDDGTHPLGIETIWNTNATEAGSLQIVLKHQPGGIKDGTCAPGDSDIDVTMPVVIN